MFFAERTPQGEIDVIGLPDFAPTLHHDAADEAELQALVPQGALHLQGGLKQPDIGFAHARYRVNLPQPVVVAQVTQVPDTVLLRELEAPELHRPLFFQVHAANIESERGRA